MAHRVTRTLGLIAAAVLIVGATAGAADVKSLVKELFAVPSTTGNEHELAAKIRALLPKGAAVEQDGLGTVAVRLSGPAGPTLVLAALDGYGHMVSGITPDGYLTVDRPTTAPHARFDAYLLGQPVVVSTAKGPVAGVVSQPALHLLTQERRKALVEGFSLENAFIDIGVRTDKEARAKGVELLDAVTFPAVLTELAGGQWAGPSLGLKAVAAVLVDVATEAAAGAAGGETVVAWAAQTKFATRGRGARPALGAVRARTKWQPKRAVVVDVVAAGKSDGFPFPGGGPVLVQAKDDETPLRRALVKLAGEANVSLQFLTAADAPLALPFSTAPSEVLTVALPVRFLNTPSEVVDLKDLQALRDLLAAFLTKGAGQ
jgi:putative aminopeptidase FrvX